MHDRSMRTFIFLIGQHTCRLTGFIPLICMSSVTVCGNHINIKNKCGTDFSAFFFGIILNPSKKFGKIESEEYSNNKRITNQLANFRRFDHIAYKDIRTIRLYCYFLPGVLPRGQGGFDPSLGFAQKFRILTNYIF